MHSNGAQTALAHFQTGHFGWFLNRRQYFVHWKRKIVRGSAPALVELPRLESMPVSLLPASPRLCLVVDRYRIEIGKGLGSEDLERVVRTLGRI